MEFKVGDRVKWTSQSAGIARLKEGVVVEVVAPNTGPTQIGTNGRHRSGQSYVVSAHRIYQEKNRSGDKRRYWPLTQKLEVNAIEAAEVLDIIGLVRECPPALEVIERWDNNTRWEVVDWAGTEHVGASDNIVRRKPVPQVIKDHDVKQSQQLSDHLDEVAAIEKLAHGTGSA